PLLPSFFYGTADRQHLPSFPTRRSSDLGDRMLDLNPGVDLHEVEIAVRVEDELDRAGAGVAGRQRPRHGRLAHLLALGGGEMDRDRKSTRLNSSHDQISYAVFCLKKKKR